MKIDRGIYKSLNQVILLANEEVNYNQIWLEINQQYSIGTIKGKVLILTSLDRDNLCKLVKKETGLDLRTDSYDKLISMTRTQLSKITLDEKRFAIPVRENYVDVRVEKDSLGIIHDPKVAYTGITVDNLLKTDVGNVVVIENRDTFLTILKDDLPSSLKNYPVLFLYRGDNKSTPKAVNNYLQQKKSNIYYFGDFDPSGLLIALAIPEVKGILVPDFSKTDDVILEKLSKKDIFRKQEENLTSLNLKYKKNYSAITKLKKYIDFINTKKVAITQEALMSHEIILESVIIK